MSIQQFILAGPVPEAPLLWARLHEEGLAEWGVAESLADFALTAHDAGQPVTVVLQGEPFACRTVASPAKSYNQLLQTVRFLLEDDLAGALDDLHIAVAGPLSAPEKKIVAVDKAVVRSWHEAFDAEGIFVDILTVDYLCLPVDPGEACVVSAGGRVLYADERKGFAAEADFAAEMLEPLLAEAEGASVYVDSAGIAQGALFSTGTMLASEEDLIGLYGRVLQSGAPANLLQGEFANQVSWGAILRPWRFAGALVAACTVLLLAGIFADGARLKSAAEALNVTSTERLQAAYPEARLTNLRAAARQRAGSDVTAGGQDFLPLVAVLTSAIETVSAVELTQLTYAADGQLVADVRVSTVEELDQLKAALQGQNILVEEGRTLTQDGDAFSGKLFLRAGA